MVLVDTNGILRARNATRKDDVSSGAGNVPDTLPTELQPTAKCVQRKREQGRGVSFLSQFG